MELVQVKITIRTIKALKKQLAESINFLENLSHNAPENGLNKNWGKRKTKNIIAIDCPALADIFNRSATKRNCIMASEKWEKICPKNNLTNSKLPKGHIFWIILFIVTAPFLYYHHILTQQKNFPFNFPA